MVYFVSETAGSYSFPGDTRLGMTMKIKICAIEVARIPNRIGWTLIMETLQMKYKYLHLTPGMALPAFQRISNAPIMPLPMADQIPDQYDSVPFPWLFRCT